MNSEEWASGFVSGPVEVKKPEFLISEDGTDAMLWKNVVRLFVSEWAAKGGVSDSPDRYSVIACDGQGVRIRVFTHESKEKAVEVLRYLAGCPVLHTAPLPEVEK